MRSLVSLAEDVLREAGFATQPSELTARESLVFENDTVMGFIVAYPNCDDLGDEWRKDASDMVSQYQFGLRKAGLKAWNTYLILLTHGSPSHSDLTALGAIEEDLQGMRKIARAGVVSPAELRAALLPLLPLQNAPRLDAIDMPQEIRIRTTEFHDRVLQAFLSEADENVVLQVLEEMS